MVTTPPSRLSSAGFKEDRRLASFVLSLEEGLGIFGYNSLKVLSDLEYEMPRMGGRGRGGPSRKPSGRWGDLMKLKRETGNKKFFNRDEMSEEQIEAAIKEMGGE